MSYKDFGLDETKKSEDGPGSIGKNFCLWCLSEVSTGFSMCFSNFCICEKCAMSATQVENNERWESYNNCDKCRQPDIIGFRSHHSCLEWFICKGCVDWSKSMFIKNQSISINTIKDLKSNRIMQVSEAFTKQISDHLQGLAGNDPLFAETFKKPAKNIKDCITYILNEVRKTGKNGFADDEIYSMAIHYYDEDNLDIGKSSTGKVVVKHQKSEIKKATVDASKVKPASPAVKKEAKVYKSLFD